jgi:hypothetical protein
MLPIEFLLLTNSNRSSPKYITTDRYWFPSLPDNAITANFVCKRNPWGLLHFNPSNASSKWSELCESQNGQLELSTYPLSDISPFTVIMISSLPTRGLPSVFILLLISLLSLPTNALYFYTKGNEAKCFFEDLPKDTLVVGKRDHF